MGDIGALVSTLQQHTTRIDATSDLEVLHSYNIDGVLPRLVTTPSAIEDAAQIVAAANQHDLQVMAYGGGSHTNLGGLADQIDVLIRTSKLTRLLEHEAPDLTCRVEAGITLADLQAQLAKQGQRLALDPPEAAQTTIGGILATNASGPRRLRYGTARDLVIGLHVIQGNGEIARSGGRVVKNVAGYDLNKLYIGSLGTLGLIAEANFKLHPLPAEERTLLLTYTNAEDAMHTAIDITRSQLTPSALELIDSGAASDMSDFFGQHLPGNGWTLAINFEGSTTTIGRQIDETYLLARKYNALLDDELEGEQQERFWQAVREHMQGTVTCKAAILVSHIAPYLQHIERICHSQDLEAAIVAHAGNGILFIELRPGDATQRLVDAINALRIHAQEARGSLVVECCPVEIKRRIDVWGEPGTDFRMMQRLKQQFDPKGTFVKGRFLGGL